MADETVTKKGAPKTDKVSVKVIVTVGEVSFEATRITQHVSDAAVVNAGLEVSIPAEVLGRMTAQLKDAGWAKGRTSRSAFGREDVELLAPIGDGSVRNLSEMLASFGKK